MNSEEYEEAKGTIEKALNMTMPPKKRALFMEICCRVVEYERQRDVPVGNLVANLRSLAAEHIRDTPNLPEYIKPFVKEVVFAQLNTIGKYLGTIELTVSRVRRVMKEED